MWTASRFPVNAAIAARCETFETFDVRCDCKLVAALMTSLGPIIQPTRQPVIAYVFATPLMMMQVSASAGTITGSEGAVAPSYNKCS